MLQMLAFSYSVPLSLSVVLMSGAAMWVILFVLLLLFCLAAYCRFLYKLMRRYIYHNDINVDMKAPRLVPLKWRIRWKIILAAQILNSKAVALWYGNPSAKLRLVGVTGTNGKTTIATVLFNMFRKMGHHCGLISTVCIRIDDEELPPIITTPCARELNSLMSRMLKAGCEYVFMECSSEGLAQKRINGLHFTGGIFTNLTRDHLNYHHTFAKYRNAKKSFFDLLSSRSFAIINADDENGRVMVSDCKASVKYYSIRSQADFTARLLNCDFNGMRLDINGREVHVRFFGSFNISNLLACYGAAVMLGKQPEDVLAVLSEMPRVKGRLDPILSPKGFIAFVDYAHTPDGLQKVLMAIHEVAGERGRVITVCGAGGDRDKGKRPDMAREAVGKSDHVIFTSDNPRNESQQAIFEDLLSGLDERQKEHVVCIEDRRAAIREACMMAEKGDVVLVAGKGHEEYQEIKGVTHHFSDMEVLEEIFSKEQPQ